eukprot:767128-Hanusia_phi.AAC.2
MSPNYLPLISDNKVRDLPWMSSSSSPTFRRGGRASSEAAVSFQVCQIGCQCHGLISNGAGDCPGVTDASDPGAAGCAARPAGAALDGTVDWARMVEQHAGPPGTSSSAELGSWQ